MFVVLSCCMVVSCSVAALRFVKRTTCLRTQKRAAIQTWEEDQPQGNAARELGTIFDVCPEYEDFENTVRNARKKLQRPVSPAMPCGSSLKAGEENATRVNSINLDLKQKVKHF